MKKNINQVKVGEIVYKWSEVFCNGSGSSEVFDTIEEAVADAKAALKNKRWTMKEFAEICKEGGFIGIEKITVDEDGWEEELEEDYVETFEITEDLLVGLY